MNGAQIQRIDRSSKNKGNRDWEGFKRPKNSGKGDNRKPTRTQLNNLRNQDGDDFEGPWANED